MSHWAGNRALLPGYATLHPPTEPSCAGTPLGPSLQKAPRKGENQELGERRDASPAVQMLLTVALAHSPPTAKLPGSFCRF